MGRYLVKVRKRVEPQREARINPGRIVPCKYRPRACTAVRAQVGYLRATYSPSPRESHPWRPILLPTLRYFGNQAARKVKREH